MKIKRVVKTAITVSGTIIMGILVNKGLSKETGKVVSKVVSEPEKKFKGIPLSKLTEIAKSIDNRDYCTIDEWGFLVLHYKSNRGRQNFQTQLKVDGLHKLSDMAGGPRFSGQRWSHASEFVKRVNENIKFE